MGIREFLSNIDTSESHLWGHGFGREVCEGCPHNTGGRTPTCDTCGCPLVNLDLAGAPPESCVRLDRHESDS